jgi:hypothetical protein
MHNLQVEEFESRQMLNGAGFYTGLLLPQPFAVDVVALRVSQHSLLVESEATAVTVGWGWSGGGRLETGLPLWRGLETTPQLWTTLRLETTPQLWTTFQLWTTLELGNFSHLGFDSKGLEDLGPGLRALDHQGSSFAKLPGFESVVPGNGAEQPSAVTVASSMLDARINPGGRALAAPVSTGSTSGPNAASVEALFAIAGDRSSLSPHPLAESPFGGHGLPALGLSIVPLKRSVTLVKEPDSGAAGDQGEPNGTGSNQAVLPAMPEVPVEAVLPSPRVADALPVLPSFNLSALELGIRQFLDGLEKLGPRLSREEGVAGRWPWIVAVAAAATACEITRRELRRLAWNTDNGEWSALFWRGLGIMPRQGGPSRHQSEKEERS